MNVTVNDPGLLPVSKCARRFKVSLSTIHRWRSAGVAGQKLACVRLGRQWFTSMEALQEFAEHCTASRPDPGVEAKRRIHEEAVRRAQRRLKLEGAGRAKK